MIQSRAVIHTEHASKYLQQLCKHWKHKFETLTYSPTEANIPFSPDITVKMFADEKELSVEILTSNEAEALRIQGVFDSHIVRFAFRETLDIHWHMQTLA